MVSVTNIRYVLKIQKVVCIVRQGNSQFKPNISRVSLSTTGFHATPDIGYDFQTNSGNAFNYFTYGVGCSTVEVDCLTGDHHVLRCKCD